MDTPEEVLAAREDERADDVHAAEIHGRHQAIPLCECGSDHSSRYSCIECGQAMCGDCVGHRDEVHCAEWCEDCLEAARNEERQ